jgi:hypothetical protein
MRSRRQVAVLPRSLCLAAFAGLTLLSAGLMTPAWAAKPGHGSVMSPAGAPLSLEIPLYDLTSEDVAALKANVAPQQAWLAAGLTSPAPLETLSVSGCVARRLACHRTLNCSVKLPCPSKHRAFWQCGGRTRRHAFRYCPTLRCGGR